MQMQECLIFMRPCNWRTIAWTYYLNIWHVMIFRVHWTENASVSDRACEWLYRQQCAHFWQNFARPPASRRAFRKRILKCRRACWQAFSSQLRNQHSVNQNIFHTGGRLHCHSRQHARQHVGGHDGGGPPACQRTPAAMSVDMTACMSAYMPTGVRRRAMERPPACSLACSLACRRACRPTCRCKCIAVRIGL